VISHTPPFHIRASAARKDHNDLYAIPGRAARSRDDLPQSLPPMYNQPSFARHLNAHGAPWRRCPFEVGALRLADAHCALGHHDLFAFFSTENLK
jgi:hypothetical protein